MQKGDIDRLYKLTLNTVHDKYAFETHTGSQIQISLEKKQQLLAEIRQVVTEWRPFVAEIQALFVAEQQTQAGAVAIPKPIDPATGGATPPASSSP